jgi:two-component system, cell cycle response regulator
MVALRAEFATTSAPAEQLTAALDGLETLPFFDPAAAFGPAVEIEAAAESLGIIDLQLRAQLIQSDVMIRRGETATGGRTIHEINRWALEHGHRPLLARSHRLLSMFFSYMGDNAVSLEHAERALELLADTAPSRLRADHLIVLAVALKATGSFEGARDRLGDAEDIAEAVGDVALHLAILNNQSYLEYGAGERQRSLTTAEQMQALAADAGVRLEATYLDTLARAQLEVGRYAEAEQTLEPMLDPSALLTEDDGLAQCLLTLVEIQRRRGHTDDARVTLECCRRVCEQRHLAGQQVRAEQQLAEIYAAEGQYEAAYLQFKLFHQAAEAQDSAERAERALTVQVVFETTAARQDSARFHEMALHDALTGLYNRRFVDDELPTLLRRSAETGEPLSIGLVDLDHFKLVNDTFSHQVGDEVLAAVAAVLEATIDEAAFVARIGGEEFLVVMPNTDVVEAGAALERVRQAVRSHRWDIAAAIDRVTVSVGTTTTNTAAGATATTQSALLGGADRNLYRAKRAGRDQVVGDVD